MSFTYRPDEQPISDTTRVRFHTGDILDGENFLSDEDIAFALSEAGDYRHATIWCLQLIISRLSQPDFSADWLTVSNKSAITGYQAILLQKRQLFHIAAIEGRAQRVHRSDSRLSHDAEEAFEASAFDQVDR